MSNEFWWSDSTHSHSTTSTINPTSTFPISPAPRSSTDVSTTSQSDTSRASSSTQNTPSTTQNSASSPTVALSQLTSTTQSGTSTLPSSSQSIPFVPASSATSHSGLQAVSGSICIGKGVDVTAIGVVASLVLCSLVGLILWFLFAYLRPKFRQVYAVREWFVSTELRPKPLGNSFWAFLWPNVPLVPSLPDADDVTSKSKNISKAAYFPSDEELSQRTLWNAFLIVLTWSIIGLAGALPLYLVKTPCVADTANSAHFGGQYSTLLDLSLLRLLNLLDNKEINTGSTGFVILARRAIVNGNDVKHSTQIRLIILVVLVVVIAAIPATIKLLREFTKLVNHRKLWLDFRCENIEMGWLSKRDAPGFDAWGENQLKDYLLDIGLSQGFRNSEEPPNGNASGVGLSSRSNRSGRSNKLSEEKAQPGIDVQGLFTIVDTSRLAQLIDERDLILNNLELAEIKYINSFRLSTPSSSVADLEIPEEYMEPEATVNSLKISRPKALGGSSRSRSHYTRRNRPYGATSPTSYMAPSSYYKLRDVRGISRLSETGPDDSLTNSISERVIGSRFQEIQRDSVAFGRIPLGSHVQLDGQTGSLGPVQNSLDQFMYRPNGPTSVSPNAVDEMGYHDNGRPSAWHYESPEDLASTAHGGPSTVQEEDEEQTTSPYSPSEEGMARPRPPKPQTPPPPERRSTFAMRSKPLPQVNGADEEVPPPHLRLQTQQPFVRPASGMDHEDLGAVYDSIRVWRSRLKAINIEIAEAQEENYLHIAEGNNVKGWLLLGCGLRHLPNVHLFEGRSKEDIRYDVLQTEHGKLDSIVFWTVVGMVVILLGAGLVAVAGLTLSPAPDVSHYLSWMAPLSGNNSLGSALATTLAPALAASLFITLGICAVHYASRFYGAPSILVSQIRAFKATFILLSFVCCVWLVTSGSLVFSLQSLASGTNRTQSVANGSIYFAIFLLVLVINAAIISPALLLLQPLHLWRVRRLQRSAVTPRQRFRVLYPRPFDPSYATACCLVAVIFAATFSLIFPLIGPAVCLLLLLTLVAHRYLIGYVYARTHSSQTGGLLQIWLIHRLAEMVALQPLLLGLILLTRKLWVLGGVSIGCAVLLVILIEIYAWRKLRVPGIKSLDESSQESLEQFRETLRSGTPQAFGENGLSKALRAQPPPRGSFASVLEMMSLTLAVTPPSAKMRGPIPLPTEDIDDLTATEQAARTNPNAPPRLPPLPFMTHYEEMHGILYAPELIAPPPIIWLPNDRSGVAQSEAVDLLRFHGLKTIIDVTSVDAIPKTHREERNES